MRETTFDRQEAEVTARRAALGETLIPDDRLVNSGVARTEVKRALLRALDEVFARKGEPNPWVVDRGASVLRAEILE